MHQQATTRPHTTTIAVLVAALLATVLTASPSTATPTTATAGPATTGDGVATPADPAAGPSSDRLVAREAEPVVLTGAQLPGWSGLPATGLAAPYPAGASGDNPLGDQLRSAHHGTLVAPPSTVNVDVDEIAAYRWDGLAWEEVPVQVDERFPHFLANGRSDFGFYSGVDEELTYAWGPGPHAAGEEAWKKVLGECVARYPSSVEEVEANTRSAANPDGVITPGAGETAADYLGAMEDPAAGLDHDDEVVVLADHAGALAPLDEDGPPGTRDGDRQQVALVDPVTGDTSYVYLFLQDGGSSFTHENGLVDHVRDGTADWFADRDSWSADDPEKLGTSNTGYGANLGGTACVEAEGTDYELGDPRPSSDRFPLDGMTVTTDDYEFVASGRWMKRSMRITRPGTRREFGEDLVDRWKGRAFQQSPDSEVSVVGFEDEQVNWEANASLLGWRSGPIRTIREVWGADSGTNVTKTETFYPSAVQYRYRVRVHPIPADGLYTSWDYNRGVAACYFDAVLAASGEQDGTCAGGVTIDGVDDEAFGNVDGLPAPLTCSFTFPGEGCEAFVDLPDPTTTVPTAVERWEQVSGTGDNGSLVYLFEYEGATSATNAAAVPYYRDDACLDDGTGDDPTPRPYPGNDSSDDVVYDDEPCVQGPDGNVEQRQGAHGSHGLHFFITQDSDNVFGPKPVTEIDGSQWVFTVPTDRPHPVGEPFAQVVRTPLQPLVTTQPSTPAPATSPQLLGGVAAVDASWHVGASSGQYAGEGPGPFVDGSRGGVDRDLHSTTSRPTYGMESRNWVRAMVLQDGDGRRWALVANDLYIPQDLLNRRVAGILSERDLTREVLGQEAIGVTDDNLTVGVSHSHTSPFYSSTAWGVWAFEDVFDIRFFEWVAQRMADAVEQAADDLRPVRLGAAEIDVTTTKRNPEGPTVGDAGAPAAYPSSDTDAAMNVVVVDDVSSGTPERYATWFTWGRHPEDVDGNDLHAGEWANATYRLLDRELGGTALFTQSDTGGSEIARDALVHEPRARQEFDHRDYNQVDRVARLVADRIALAVADVDRAADGLPPLHAQSVVAPRTDLPIGVSDVRFAPPGYRPYPTVSNCRSDNAFEGNPGVPIVGLPDCGYYLGPVQDANPLPTGATVQQLRDAGVPIPDNLGGPSYTGLQESLVVHLQAIRLGDIAVTVCPCEMFTDTRRNIQSRLDDVPSNFWYGFDWNANPIAHPDFEPGIAYDGQDSDGDGTFDPGHGPLTLPDEDGQHFCVPDDEGSQWTCRDPRDPSATLEPISDEVLRRWKARIYNDAAGWDEIVGDDLNPNAFESEAEPSDPEQILGNWIHEELDEVMVGGGYEMVVPVSMANDYWGYQPPYSEFQNRDYYRKALSGLGPHATDFMATRLTRMAATLRGASPSLVEDKETAKDRAYVPVEDENMRGRAAVIGNLAQTYLPTYEAGLPADAGTPGEVLTQPADVTRFDATMLEWVGGSNYTDVPEVAVERCVAGDCTSDEHFVPFGDGWAEVQVLPDFPDANEELASQQAGQFTWRWAATFEAYSSDVDEPDLTGVVRDQTPEGTYRFRVRGCHRGMPAAGPTPGDPTGYCGAHDPTGRVAEYAFTSDTFEVSRWDGITVDGLALDDGAVSFTTGPDLPYPTDWSNSELTTFSSAAGDVDGVARDTTIGRYSQEGRDVVDYPNSYDSPFAWVGARDDDDCLGDGGCEDLRTYDSSSELFCFTCAFQPWADTGVVETATVAVTRFPSGQVDEVPASWDAVDGRWSAPVELFPGDRVQVRRGDVLDAFGETNQPSETIEVPPAEVTVADVQVVEGDVGATTVAVPVTLSAPTDDVVTVTVDSATGTTSADDHETLVDEVVTIPAGETQALLQVDVTGDTSNEGDETFTLTLSEPTAAVLGDVAVATVTIIDDDEEVHDDPVVDVADASVVEGDAGERDLVVQVRLDREAAGTVSVTATVEAGTATDGQDVRLPDGPLDLELAPGERVATILVPVLGDDVDEDDETLTVTLSDVTGNATVGRRVATGTIVDDDGAPTITIEDAEVVEGAGDLLHEVRLSNPSASPVEVDWDVTAGTADDTDVALGSGHATVPPGSTSTTIVVAVLDDELDEDRETVDVTLSAPSAATLADDTAVGTIVDDDARPGLSIDDVDADEGDEGQVPFRFRVRLTAVSGRDVSVDWRTVNVSALSGSDFVPTDETLTIPAGATSRTVAVDVLGDTDPEPDERFDVLLEDPEAATLVDERGIACIRDDDGGDGTDHCSPTPPSEPGGTDLDEPEGTDDPGPDDGDQDEDGEDDGEQEPATPTLRRHAGQDRYRTAIAVSRERFPDRDSTDVVLLARGDDPDGFADALAGAPLAADLDAPLLLTDPTTLPDTVRVEIRRVLADGGRVVLLGGPVAIATGVEQVLRADGHRTERIAGATRFHTAVRIAERLDSPDTAFLATGLDFPDALSASAAAVHVDGAVLLTDGPRAHPATTAWLRENRPEARWAVGGPALAAHPSATPLVGRDRVATSVAVARAVFEDPPVVGIARADRFPDALSGGPHVGRLGGPVLLSDSDRLSPATRDAICDVASGLDEVHLYGGPEALTSDMESTIGVLLGGGC